MSDQSFFKLYREAFSDLTIDREESSQLRELFSKANPPPDKIVSLRGGAFRIGCEFITEEDDDESRQKNISLLKSINGIVHALELSCLIPKASDIKEDESNTFDKNAVEILFQECFADLSIDREESKELFDFFKLNNPPTDMLVWTRATAFRIGCDFLTKEKAENVKLLKCINYIVHVIEQTCMEHKPYILKQEVPQAINVTSIGLDSSISKAVQYIWDLDVNRLTPDSDYEINVQKGKKPYWKGDEASDPLFVRVDSSAFRRPTYKAFIALLDNYSANTGVAEVVTSHEKKENKTFLNAIMQTGPMQFCHKYCCANNSDVPRSINKFIDLLHNIWFDLYFRQHGGRPDSSGFEHVFVGEIKNGEVSGFHNWIMLYLEEMKGNLNYKGYIKPRNKDNAETNSDDHVLTLQFDWNGVEKKVGTSFIGVSPEFEMALYTMCFLVGQKENKVELKTGTGDIFALNVKVYTMAKNKIGTSFVEALDHFD